MEGSESAVVSMIDVLRNAHSDNGTLFYYSTKDPSVVGEKIMPVTPFVFELFIYNSIYQVDWNASWKTRKVTYHPRDVDEQNKCTVCSRGPSFSESKQQGSAAERQAGEFADTAEPDSLSHARERGGFDASSDPRMSAFRAIGDSVAPSWQRQADDLHGGRSRTLCVDGGECVRLLAGL
jgi:hypothetical protein